MLRICLTVLLFFAAIWTATELYYVSPSPSNRVAPFPPSIEEASIESDQPLVLTMSDRDLSALLDTQQGFKPLIQPPPPPRIEVAPEIGKLQDYLSRVHFSLDEKRRPMIHFVFGEERTEEPRR